MPLWMPPSAGNFQGQLSIANGGSAAASARDAQKNLSGIYVLAQSAVQATLTGGTVNTETVISTITIPAGALGANGRVRVTALFGCNNNANTKRCRIRFNGLAGTIYYTTDLTTVVALRAQVEIANRNATNSQVGAPNGLGAGGWFSTSSSLVTSAIDTTAAVDIALTGTLVTANTDTITVESYLVELLANAGS